MGSWNVCRMGNASIAHLLDTFRSNSIVIAGLQEAQHLDSTVCKRLFDSKGWVSLFSAKMTERNTMGRAAICYNKAWAARQNFGLFKSSLKGDRFVVGIWSRLTVVSVYLPT